GGQSQPVDDHHSDRGRHHHRPRRARRSRLRQRRVAGIRALARLLFQPARRSIFLAPIHGAPGRRRSGHRILGDPGPRRRLPAGLARATHGALRAHSKRGLGDVTLSAQSLTKRFGAAPGYDAVRNASLDLHAGEFVAIVGRSGSGKSTLMAMLGALTKPTEGKVLLDGTDIWALSETELAAFRSRRIGFVFQ